MTAGATTVVPDRFGPQSLITSLAGTLVAVGGVPLVLIHGLLSAWTLVPFIPGVFGLFLLLFRSMRQVSTGFIATLLVPAVTAVALLVSAVAYA